MYGSATAAMEVSSTSMNVASMTATAIIQGLVCGRATVIPPIGCAVAAKGPLNANVF